jgi:phosphoglucosamine mutase
MKTHGDIGKVSYVAAKASEDYIDHLESTIDSTLGGMRILVDCANGAASATASRLFGRFSKLRCDVINAVPDGININDKCGSTHMDSLAAMVKAGGYDIGIAFDGDADRCLAVDELGGLIDGDQIMAACGLDMLSKGKLPDSTVVATVMSNLGFHVYAKEHGMKLECTNVGDRHVLERMVEKGYSIGGEQSGHMIFLEYATTGDGQLSGLQFAAAMARTGKSASELASVMTAFPQVLVNVTVKNELKGLIKTDEEIIKSIKDVEAELGDNGRILVRASGTEPLIRVMIEGEDIIQINDLAHKVADVIKEKTAK